MGQRMDRCECRVVFSRMRLVRRLSFSCLLLAALTACSEPTFPSAGFAGEYQLVLLNSQPLPSPYTSRPISGSLTLRKDGTYERRIRIRATNAEGYIDALESGFWRARGNTIERAQLCTTLPQCLSWYLLAAVGTDGSITVTSHRPDDDIWVELYQML